ncbi:hypothetical protein HHK36_029957 [Tetracentron sinense]|uniref:RanBP2-type domain-containing protein n=1 Tax=Tetracentron sinense TaxID=13715 RepID=A0A834YFP6_TETSI|nr:hypothetical protein HHK36_029957 [Tetracentron sinense]
MNMAASKLSLIRASIFHNHRTAPATASSISNTLLRNPSFSPTLLSFLLNKTHHSPSIQFHSHSSSVAIDDLTDEVEIDSHPWPEWVTFIDRLKNNGYFNGSSSPVEAGGVVNAAVTTTIPKDLNSLRNACLRFARDRFDILKSLSMKEIQTVVECGCPSLFHKAVNSAKRLRVFVRLDEGDVCSACNLRGSCDRSYVILKEPEAGARTVDIVRILLMYALDPLVLSGGEKPHGRENVEASARKLFSELIELSDTSPDLALPKPATKPPCRKEQSESVMDQDQYQNVEMKRGDWMCSKCNFMNFARNIQCLQCKEEGPKRVGVDDVEMKKGDWNCPQCNFMNFARNIQCLQCKEEGPKRVGFDNVEMKEGDWNCPQCNFMNFARNIRCLQCKEEGPKRGGVDEVEMKKGDWNCQQCDFLNYSRNMVCLKCNCKRPKDKAM